MDHAMAHVLGAQQSGEVGLKVFSGFVKKYPYESESQVKELFDALEALGEQRRGSIELKSVGHALLYPRVRRPRLRPGAKLREADSCYAKR